MLYRKAPSFCKKRLSYAISTNFLLLQKWCISKKYGYTYFSLVLIWYCIFSQIYRSRSTFLYDKHHNFTDCRCLHHPSYCGFISILFSDIFVRQRPQTCTTGRLLNLNWRTPLPARLSDVITFMWLYNQILSRNLTPSWEVFWYCRRKMRSFFHKIEYWMNLAFMFTYCNMLSRLPKMFCVYCCSISKTFCNIELIAAILFSWYWWGSNTKFSTTWKTLVRTDTAVFEDEIYVLSEGPAEFHDKTFFRV